MSVNPIGHLQNMNQMYINVGANQARRIGPMQQSMAYRPQVPNGPQVVASLADGQRVVMNQRQQVSGSKTTFPRQHYQPYVHQGQIQMQANTQMPTPYPYCGTYISPSTSQISGDYATAANSGRIYSRYIRHSKPMARVKTEEKPSPLSYPPHPQQRVPIVSSVVPCKKDEERSSVYQYGIEDCDGIGVRTIAILVGESGFKPFSDLQISKGCAQFTIVLQDRNKNTVRTLVYVEDIHIANIWLGKCSWNMYVLAISLNEHGRQALPSQLQWVDRIKSHDIVFLIKSFGQQEMFHSKLTNFFGSKLKYYARNDFRHYGALVHSAILVTRYSRFLEKAEGYRKDSEGTEKPTPSSPGNLDRVERSDLSVELQPNDGYYYGEPGNAESKIETVVDKSLSGTNIAPQDVFAIDRVQQNLNVHPTGNLTPFHLQERQRIAKGSQELIGTRTGIPKEPTKEKWANSADSGSVDCDDVKEATKEEWTNSVNGGSGDCDEVNQEFVSLLYETGDDGDLTKEILETSTNLDRNISSELPVAATEYLRTFTCSDSQIIDFPEDFLENCCSFDSDEKKPVLPKSIECIGEELTLDDDELEKEEPSFLKFDGNITVDVMAIRQCMLQGAFMTGSLATFYFKHYIPYVILKDDYQKDKICFFDSENYGFIRRRCESEISLNLEKEITFEMAIAAFGRRKKGELHSFVMNLVQFELIVMPLFWDNHWLLGLLQMFPDYDKDSISGRLVLVDSKFDDPINKEILARISANIHRHIEIAVRAALITSAKPRHLDSFELVRCDSLPCQKNNSDCGWFMCLFAEYYTTSMKWMDFSDEEVRHMTMHGRKKEQFLDRLGIIKREIGAYMEKTAKRSLDFEYNKVANNPTALDKKGCC